MTRRAVGVLLALGGLAALHAGCGAGPPSLARRPDGCTGTPGGSLHSVQVYLRVRGGSGGRPFCPGETLRPGDALQLEVEAQRAAHARLLFADPGGGAGAIDPQEGDVAASRFTFQVPEGLLVGRPGVAELLVLISVDPLEEADPAMHAMYEVVRETGTHVDAAGGLHPPGGAPASGAPLHFSSHSDLAADFDAHGVAALGISLHVGR